MKITLFAKSIHSRDGKSYAIFVTNLERKDGSKQYATVRYVGDDTRMGFDSKRCPCIINIEKGDANLSKKTRTVTDSKTGESRTVDSYTLWVKKYTEAPEKWVDHSLDEFE